MTKQSDILLDAGDITLVSLGLDKVDNTADANKPVSTAQSSRFGTNEHALRELNSAAKTYREVSLVKSSNTPMAAYNAVTGDIITVSRSYIPTSKYKVTPNTGLEENKMFKYSVNGLVQSYTTNRNTARHTKIYYNANDDTTYTFDIGDMSASYTSGTDATKEQITTGLIDAFNANSAENKLNLTIEDMTTYFYVSESVTGTDAIDFSVSNKSNVSDSIQMERTYTSENDKLVGLITRMSHDYYSIPGDTYFTIEKKNGGLFTCDAPVGVTIEQLKDSVIDEIIVNLPIGEKGQTVKLNKTNIDETMLVLVNGDIEKADGSLLVDGIKSNLVFKHTGIKWEITHD